MIQPTTLTKNNSEKTLIVITGPTAVGKTNLSLDVAGFFNTHIISADARQFYRELKIGTAAPTADQLARVPHHLVGQISIRDYYNVSMFENQALNILEDIFKNNDYAVVTGGSGLYIDVLCNGIDDLPDPDPDIRNEVKQYFISNDLNALRLWLKNVDPEYYDQVDLSNPNRIMRGIEIFLMTGRKFSELRLSKNQQRPFKIKKLILNLERSLLYNRINLRVDQMIEEGLIEEAWGFFNQRYLNALNTVGYKEIFSWLANDYSLQMAIEKIKVNTRRYAKRQLTWFRKYDDAKWFEPNQLEQIIKFIEE